MSKHECLIAGSVTLKGEVTQAQVEQAFVEFITRSAASECSIELDGAELHVVLNYRCYGGVENEFVELLKFALNPIVDGGNYLIQLDPDTGDPDEASLPIFLGETGTDQQYAQKRFACDEMVKWLEPVVSSAHLAAITDLIFEDFSRRPPVTAEEHRPIAEG